MKKEIINFWLEDKDDKKYPMTFDEFYQKFINSKYYDKSSMKPLEYHIFIFIIKKDGLNSNYEKAKIFQLVDYVSSQLLKD